MMPSLQLTSFPIRGVFAALAVVCALLVSSPARASAPSATVVSVEPSSTADLVVLDHGFDAGLRRGMVCRVTRGGTVVAELLLVTLRPTCGTALILDLTPAQTIRAGDVATVKLLKT